MPKVVIVSNPKRQRPNIKRERRNVFSDKTNLYLLRLLRRETGLPDTLGNAHAIPHDTQLELAAAIRQRVLPWFWSILLHSLLVILLAIHILPSTRYEPLDMLSGLANIPFPSEAQIDGLSGIAEGFGPSVDNSQVGTPITANEPAVPKIEPTHSSPGLNFSGRDIDWRSTRLGSGGGGGGGGGTDEAVLAGLRWLVKVQQPNGAWHFSGSFLHSAHRDRDDALAATAMALLAFQGYGISPNSKHPLLIEFALPVRKGWDWLLRQQNPDGSFVSPSASPIHHFYTHGLCTIALCELLAMTGDETLREPAQRAIDYCVGHQSISSGGWRYLPDRFSEQSDVSATGWIVLALKTGQAAGLTVPAETYSNVMKFLDSMAVAKTYQYRYREEDPEPRIAMTAEALLCRILLGWRRSEPGLTAGVKAILETPPSFTEHYQRDVYYWFFASQTLYHYGGNEWKTWDSTMRSLLLQYQEKAGAEAGSWHPEQPVRDAWGAQYGRLYATCMSLYILEVYYRHLPIFPETGDRIATSER